MEYKIKRYTAPLLDANCYLITLNDNNSILDIIIDPCISYSKIKKDLKSNTLYVLITHGHYDHFAEIESYLNEGFKIYLHKNAVSKLESSVKNCSKLLNLEFTVNINEQFLIVEPVPYNNNNNLNNKNNAFDIFNLELFNGSHKFIIEVFESLGHTNCSLCYKIGNSIFTGDFLFSDSIGRVDLYSGSQSEMNKSLNKLNSLSKSYFIYPGHYDSISLADCFKINRYIKNS